MGFLYMKMENPDLQARMLRKLRPVALRSRARSCLKEGLEIIANGMRWRCPVDTGAMRDSIKVEMYADDSGAPWGRVVVGAKSHGIYYPSMVEFGTVYQAAHPFFRPAIDANYVRAMQTVRRGLEAV